MKTRHGPAKQQASSYDNFPLQPGWRPLIHLPQAKQLLRGNVTLGRYRPLSDFHQWPSNGRLHGTEPHRSHSTPNFKFLQKNRFTKCNCVTPLLCLPKISRAELQSALLPAPPCESVSTMPVGFKGCRSSQFVLEHQFCSQPRAIPR